MSPVKYVPKGVSCHHSEAKMSGGEGGRERNSAHKGQGINLHSEKIPPTRSGICARKITRSPTHPLTPSRRGKRMAGILMLLLVMLLSCRSSDSGSSSGWKTYRNPRYNFEFPYPSNWSPFPMPDNLDGQAFRDPQNPTSEIRGWAAQNALKEPLTPQQPNFTTEQGVRGKLQVEVGADISLMTLTLSQGKV
ncbi:MAG: hypothetical protein LDL41_20375, partial [Coleofasciculus sp. S288]|nr:hypothetical protein [Coleofasciculus sp. S288]